MKRFEKVIHHTMKWEGGYVNDRFDPGGETKFGISKRSYPRLNIKDLTEYQAVEIYRRDFWKPYHDEINSFQIASRLFDLSVNMGHKNPNKLLQRAVNDIGGDIVDDGVIGPNTISAINNSDENQLYSAFYARAKNRYERLSKRNGGRFLKGWMRRLNDPITE
jgi:lysozyme family protein